MKYLRQLLMILIFSFIGEVLHAVIPIQMPASIYGLVLLFIALMTVSYTHLDVYKRQQSDGTGECFGFFL